MNQKVLLAVAGGLAVLVVLVYAWKFFFTGQGRESPERLAQAALSASDADAQHAAAVRLARLGAEGRAQMLQVLKESRQPGVRAAMVQGLGDLYAYEAMPLLLDALDDGDAEVAGLAGVSVERLLGRDYGLRRDGRPEERKARIQKARAEWELLRGSDRLERWKKRLAEKKEEQP